MPELDEILRANEAYSASLAHDADRPARPARGLAIVTCMDVRLDPMRALGLDLGDAHVVRNAGGRMTDDAVRSLVLSTRTLGTREVGVIHHTKCALEGSTETELAARTGVDGMAFLPFADLDGGVREDVGRLRETPGVPAGLTVWGAVYDVDTGALRVIET